MHFLSKATIFQELAISIVFGILASTVLTFVVVPLVFHELHQKKGCPEGRRTKTMKRLFFP